MLSGLGCDPDEMAIVFPALTLQRSVCSAYIEIESKYLEYSGLLSKGNSTFVMLRKEVQDLFSFLEAVTKGPCFCNVTGAPGTGKSLACFAFMCTLLDRDFTITWIHFYKLAPARCIRFVAGGKIHQQLRVGQIAAFLGDADQNKTHILFVDGITNEQSELETICCAWMMEDQERRPVVMTTSMAAGFNLSEDEERLLNYCRFDLFSWAYEEYLDLIKNKQFFEKVEGMLDAHVDLSSGRVTTGAGSKRLNPSSLLTDEDKLSSKYHFAGGSSRAMFDMTTQKLVLKIRRDVSRAENVFGYLSGENSECSNIAVNNLISWFCGDDGSTRCAPVSTFAASTIAQKLGPRLVSNLRKALKPAINPSVDSSLFEMWIFAKLKDEGLKFQEKTTPATEWSDNEWNASSVFTFDPHGRMPAIQRSISTWLKPIKWQQGGYDAVQLNVEKESIIFLQITRSASHSFKTEYFEQLLLQIKHVWGVNIRFLEIYFVVPHLRASDFKIEKPTDSGFFSEYFVPGCDGTIKWDKASELDHVKVCSVDNAQDYD